MQWSGQRVHFDLNTAMKERKDKENVELFQLLTFLA